MVYIEIDKEIKKRVLKDKYNNMQSRGRCPSTKHNQAKYRNVYLSEEFMTAEGYDIFVERIESTGGLYMFNGKYPETDKDLLAVYGQDKVYAPNTILLLDGHANRFLEYTIAKDRTVPKEPDADGLFTFRKNKYGTYEEALASFCKYKTEEWLRLIDERMDLEPDYVLEAMRNYDIFKWNGLNKADYEEAIA